MIFIYIIGAYFGLMAVILIAINVHIIINAFKSHGYRPPARKARKIIWSLRLGLHETADIIAGNNPGLLGIVKQKHLFYS